MKGEYISIETSKIMGEIEKENKELQQRIDKAIKFLRDKEYDTERCEVCDSMSRKLLDILKGRII